MTKTSITETIDLSVAVLETASWSSQPPPHVYGFGKTLSLKSTAADTPSNGGVKIRRGKLRDVIAVERIVIWAKQPRVAENLKSRSIASGILFGIAMMRRANHAMDFLGAKAMGQEYHFYTIVAEVDGSICGACMINTALGRDPLVWFLGPIAVANEFRGRGIGTFLIDEAVRTVRADGGKQIFLSVAHDNLPAIALYKKSGFRETDAETAMILDIQRE